MTTPAKKTAARKTTAPKPPAAPDVEDAVDTTKVEQAPAEPSFEEKWVDAEERAAGALELADARGERIALLEQQIAALTTSATPTPEQVEVFVAEGNGKCLDCSCEQYNDMPEDEPTSVPDRCWGCNHPKGQHKRNPKGAVWKDAS